MEFLAEILAIVCRVLTKWLEFTVYAMQLILYGPFLIMIVGFLFTTPFIAIWYVVTHRDGYSLWIILCLIVAALMTFVIGSRDHDDDDPPVKRGRSLLTSDQARRSSTSKLKR